MRFVLIFGAKTEWVLFVEHIVLLSPKGYTFYHPIEGRRLG